MSKIAVVTAASKGIGAATAKVLGANGYDVVINYLSDELAARKVAQSVEASGHKALLVQADVFTEQGVAKLFEAVKTEFGTIDVLVNNAGFPKEPAFGDWTSAAILKSLSGNVTSAVLCTQAAVPLMKDGGNILFTSSVYGLNLNGNPTLVLYSAGKAAVINFAQTMAEKLAPKIRCNVVAPGSTKTPAWNNADPAYVTDNLEMTLQKEWVLADEIADTFMFLIKTPHMNAQTIVVDGGWQKKIRPKH